MTVYRNLYSSSCGDEPARRRPAASRATSLHLEASLTFDPARGELYAHRAGSPFSGEISFNGLMAILLSSLCISSMTLVLAAQEMAR